MQMTGHACSKVHVFAHALESDSLVEVRRANTLAHNVPVDATRHVCHVEVFAYVNELLPDFAGFPHRFSVDKVIHAPLVTISKHG
jgi:hypothetical protein